MVEITVAHVWKLSVSKDHTEKIIRNGKNGGNKERGEQHIITVVEAYKRIQILYLENVKVMVK